MNNEHKQAIIEALKFYLPIAAPHKPDKHIELLEEVIEELEKDVPPALPQDLLDT